MCGYMLIEERGLFAKLRCNVRTLLGEASHASDATCVRCRAYVAVAHTQRAVFFFLYKGNTPLFRQYSMLLSSFLRSIGLP